METLPTSTQSFSVDFLLGHIAANSAVPHSPEQDNRFVEAAIHAKTMAQITGDTGNMLVVEVEAFLAESADSLQRFATIVQQMGDACLDHTVEHEISHEASETEHNHNNGIASHDHSSSEQYESHSCAERKKRKSKRHRRDSLLGLYLQRIKTQQT